MIFTRIPNSSFCCCCPPDDHLQEAGPSFCQPQKGQEKCIFETLHNEIECVLSIKESNFNEKISYLLMVRQNISSLTPPFRRGVKKSGYFTAGLTVSVYPHLLSVSFLWNFFGVFFILDYDSICVLKRILHKKKSIFMQLLESPIPPLTAAHLIVGGYFWNSASHSHSGWLFLK